MADAQTADDVFETTVAKATQDAEQNLGRYKFRLWLFAMLGYAFIFLVLAALVALVGGTVATAVFSLPLFLLLLKKKILLIIIPAIWVLMKALWVRLEAPSGYELKRRAYPELYGVLDELASELDTPRIHNVILTPELNAAISQTPRLGIFGWYKNTLILGLELLMTLSPEQARAVIAHELGHLSGNHSRFNGWIYRARISWARIMYAFQQQASMGAQLMARFFNWYVPRFSAYSFALARINEYEADRVAAELTSANDTGSALINSHVTGPYVDDTYWQEFFKLADEAAEPPHMPWQGLHDFLLSHNADDADLKERLGQALQRETASDDTHPSLTDRLNALNAANDLPPASQIPAAQQWFGDRFANVLKDFDDLWYTANQNAWQERYEYVTTNRATLAELKAQSQTSLNDDDLWQLALLLEEFDTNEAALEAIQAYQQRHPDDPNAAFVCGRIYYALEDERLLEQMEKALTQPSLVINACEYAYYFLAQRDREDEGKVWIERAEAQQAINAEAEAERNHLAPDAELAPLALSEEALAQLVENLQASGKVKKAWIAQKVVQHYPEVPAMAIAIVGKGYYSSVDDLAQKVADCIETDATLFIVPKAGDYKKLAKNIIKTGDRIL